MRISGLFRSFVQEIPPGPHQLKRVEEVVFSEV